MCGIAGGISFKGNPLGKPEVDALLNSLRHRGPDANGSYADDTTSLVQTRLSIIDLDERSNQPFYDPEGRYVLVFNGEIYNYQEIRSQLQPFDYKTNSDTEVILAAWKQKGVSCLKEFNGMFALAMWDKQEQELYLCRDRLGIKPVYYHHQNETLLFSSELRALLNTGLVDRKLAKANLAEYLKYQTVHAPRTIIKDVYMLEAGSYLKFSELDLEQHRYWDIENKAGDSISSVEEAKKKVKELLVASVERRLISDVPLGAFLSGGIDSSLLVGIVREELGKSIDTFSITFPEKEFSEAPYSQLIAKKFSTRHNEIELDTNVFKGEIVHALAHMDHPSGDGPNSYVVSQAVKQEGITVALSGLGGDELFAGYPFFLRHLELQKKKALLSIPYALRKSLAPMVPLLKKGVAGQKVAETLSLPNFNLDQVYPVNRKLLNDATTNALLSTSVQGDALVNDLKAIAAFTDSSFDQCELSKVSIAEITTYMQNVLLRDSDQMSMAHALEVRVPFLDHKLVEYCIGIPDQIKHPNYPKSLLVESFGKLLPDEIVHRPKMGFVLPWSNWLKGDLKPLVEDGLDYIGQLEYFNQKQVSELYQRFLNSDPTITWSRLWPLVALGVWMKNNAIE